MDKTSIIGLILAVIAIGFGMVLKGVEIGVLLNPAALLIIFLGTAAAVIIAFPTKEIKRVPKLLKIVFTEQKLVPDTELIQKFSEMAQVARKEGLLALETIASDIDDPFLRNGLTLAVDGQNAEYIRDVLTEEIEAMEERHYSGAAIFSQAGTYAPTLGVLGAVVGLIAALTHMEDTEALGASISAAFVATLMGIFSGYMLWHPFANKLKQKSKAEAKQKRMIIEGILSILEGENPRLLEQKLASFLPEDERKNLLKEGVNDNA
ncbi:MAG TPA: flagellar motor stator protein MotA [Bacillus sp. (in: firmicutes)]|uniref:flagellar motor stator protein MotA n=1 Tax=Bacillus litorisediminis TaxID=2922713 RepID=UPI001FACFFFD|nr:flagellar motor stator protein MotA [Bacillus litorisediminis]HWO74592.1 flagellar motor stator protein MotA [Bacillus sp. (in: firmicutes)]